MFKKIRLGTVFLLALLFGVAYTEPAPAQSFGEDLGNFPDAIEVSAEFTTVMIDGVPDPVPGFLFHLTNTSYGGHSSFDNDPDGDFAVRDVLTSTAGAAIAAAQPFGIYSFGAMLPNGSGEFTLAPDGFAVHFDPLDSVTNMREINFPINLKNPSGLIFDDNAPSIPAIFTAPRWHKPDGPTFDFFISTPLGFTPDQLPQVRNDPGIDIATQMAWAELKNGVQTVQTKFKFNGRRLRPRGELVAIDQPPPPPPA